MLVMVCSRNPDKVHCFGTTFTNHSHPNGLIGWLGHEWLYHVRHHVYDSNSIGDLGAIASRLDKIKNKSKPLLRKQISPRLSFLTSVSNLCVLYSCACIYYLPWCLRLGKNGIHWQRVWSPGEKLERSGSYRLNTFKFTFSRFCESLGISQGVFHNLIRNYLTSRRLKHISTHSLVTLTSWLISVTGLILASAFYRIFRIIHATGSIEIQGKFIYTIPRCLNLLVWGKLTARGQCLSNFFSLLG